MDESGANGKHKQVRVDWRSVVGVMAGVGCNVDSAVLVATVQVGFIAQLTLVRCLRAGA